MRPATLLVGALAVTSVLTALSLWIRLLALDPERPVFIVGQKPTAFDSAYRLLNADGEGNVTTWFSTVLLFSIALVCLGVGMLLRARSAPLRRYWLGLALVFGYLSVDELAWLHEELIPRMDGIVEAEGAFTFPWVVVAAPLVILFAVVYAGFLWKLPRRTAALFVLAGLLYVGGALGLEAVGGLFYGDDLGANVAYVLVTTVEECLEMIGAALFLYAVARYAEREMRAGRAPDDQRADGGRNTANGSVTASSGVTNR
ncbi:hypothetical protein [Blastococcus sp. SYSU DS0617]